MQKVNTLIRQRLHKVKQARFPVLSIGATCSKTVKLVDSHVSLLMSHMKELRYVTSTCRFRYFQHLYNNVVVSMLTALPVFFKAEKIWVDLKTHFNVNKPKQLGLSTFCRILLGDIAGNADWGHNYKLLAKVRISFENIVTLDQNDTKIISDLQKKGHEFKIPDYKVYKYADLDTLSKIAKNKEKHTAFIMKHFKLSKRKPKQTIETQKQFNLAMKKIVSQIPRKEMVLRFTNRWFRDLLERDYENESSNRKRKHPSPSNEGSNKKRLVSLKEQNDD